MVTEENEPSDLAESPSTLAPVRFRRAGPLVLLAIAAALLSFVAPTWPHEQHVRVPLGDLAPRVVAVDLEYGVAGVKDDSAAARAASFRYATGQAPRVVEHMPSLPNGQTSIEVTIDLVDPVQRLDGTRSVTLDGNAVTLPLPPALLSLH